MKITRTIRFWVCAVFLLCCFCAVPVVFGSSDSDQLENSGSECSVKCQDFRALANKHRELEKSFKEMRVQFKSLRTEVEELKAENSVNDDVWLLTPPLRGRRGMKGEKGDSGPNGRAGKAGEKGDSGPNGRAGKAGEKGGMGQNGGAGTKGDGGEKGERGQVGPKGQRGSKGEPGAKGERGLSGSKGEKGEEGDSGPKGERGLSAPQSIGSCSVAMEILPSPRSRKQTIYPHENLNKKVEVLCDFETDGGGWTLIQKRSSGPKYEFQKNWNEYKNGFGSLQGNFWLGLDNIHALTQNGDQELRIELEDFEGEKRWAKYSSFSISDASDFYRLNIGGFYANSTAGDSMTNPNWPLESNNGHKFSTKDVDNDNKSGSDCSVENHGGGGWWFNACSLSGLNGLCLEKGTTARAYSGIGWYSWKQWNSPLAKSEMKIRQRKFK